MSQYRIQMKDGGSVPADDVRSLPGGMIEYIEPYSHQVEKIWGGEVQAIRESNENLLGPFGKLFEPKFPR